MGLPAPSIIERPQTVPHPSLSPIAEAALLAAFDQGSQAIGLFDADDRLIYGNEAFRRGWAIHDTRGVTFDSMIRNCHRTRQGAVVATDDIEAWLTGARRNRREGPADRSFEVDLWDGRWMWLTERRLDDGWLLFIAQDITALKKSERTLRLARDAAVKASLTDPLTQLPNRRHAMQALDGKLLRKERFHVALIDIDGFKQINDRFGHATGDDVLVMLGSELARLEARTCLVARLAGDEFLVIGADATQDAFEGLLRGLLSHRHQQCMLGGPARAFGISIGVASFPEHGKDARQLLSAADAAMYRAKARGACALQIAS